MSDNEKLDVLIAVYLDPRARAAGLRRVRRSSQGEARSSTDGVALVVKDAEGEVAVQETGDHLGRKDSRSAPASAW